MVVIVVIVVVGLLVVVASVHALIQSAMESDIDKEVEFVVILGAGLRDNQPSLSLRYRLQAAIEYLEKHPRSNVIVSGGLGIGERHLEAQVMKDFLMEAGIAAERIIKEKKATNTLENLLYSKQKIIERKAMEAGVTIEEMEIALAEKPIELMIATSDFHLFRSKMIAKRLGFEPYGIPARTPSMVATQLMLREYAAVVKSYVFDRYKAS